MRLVRPAKKSASPIVKDFAPHDTIDFSPTLGAVTDIESDKTVDAILTGNFGPAVVVFVADWCGHCKNIAAAYEAAASQSDIPFVRIKGEFAPVSSSKFGIAGYPTVLGFASVGGPPRRFASQRTPDALVQFAVGLRGTVIEPHLLPTMPSALPAMPPALLPVVRTEAPAEQPNVVTVPVILAEPPMASTVEILSKE